VAFERLGVELNTDIPTYRFGYG